MNASDFVLNRLAKERVQTLLREAKNDALARQAPRVLGIAAVSPQLPQYLTKLLDRFGAGRAEPCPTC